MEEVPHQLLGHRLSELTADLQRMMVVKSGVDARPKDLVDQVAGVFKGVIMHTVHKRLAVHQDVYTRGAEKAGDQRRHRPGYAAVCRGILWMSRRRSQWKPGRIRSQIGVAASGENGGYGPPEAVLIFGIEASDGRVREPGPKHR